MLTLLVPAVNSLFMWLTKIHRDTWTFVNDIFWLTKIVTEQIFIVIIKFLQIMGFSVYDLPNS